MLFTGPELWWVAEVAHLAADTPAATVPVPDGLAGVLLVGSATALLLLPGHAAVAAAPGFARRPGRPGCGGGVLLAWSLSELLDPEPIGRPFVTPSWGERGSPLHLVLGDEDLVVERAVAEVLRRRANVPARRRPGEPNAAGDVGTYELAELLSPSLFATNAVVVRRPPPKRARTPLR